MATDQVKAATNRARAPARLMGTSPKENEWFISTATPHNAYQQSQSEPNRKPLGAQKDDFEQRNEYRNGRQHHRCNPRRHALFSPEQAAVVDKEDQAPSTVAATHSRRLGDGVPFSRNQA